LKKKKKKKKSMFKIKKFQTFFVVTQRLFTFFDDIISVSAWPFVHYTNIVDYEMVTKNSSWPKNFCDLVEGESQVRTM